MTRKRSPRTDGEDLFSPPREEEESALGTGPADAREAAAAAEGDPPAAAHAGPPREPGQDGELAGILAALEAQHAEALLAWREREDSLLRQLAERENQRRRLARDLELEVDFARGRMIEPMIAILDDLERALEHLPADEESAFSQGIRQIADRLRGSLAELGLTPIEALGQKFDPALHEAMMQVESAAVARGYIVQEIQKGYLLGKRVLRPSKVAVSA